MTCDGRFSIALCVGLAIAALSAHNAGAADRTPDDFLNLDLKSAVLSPEPLGPPSHFERLSVQASTEPKRVRTTVETAASAAPPPGRPAHAIHHHFAQRHRNPLNAQASTPRPRIQRWPCKSGGICAWTPTQR